MEASDSLRQKKIKFFCPILDTATCMSAYLLLKYGKIRNESKSIAIFDGHSDISVTLNTYTHVNLEDAREEVTRIQVV